MGTIAKPRKKSSSQVVMDQDSSHTFVTVIIPTKEEPLLQKLIDDVNLTLDSSPHEVIIVDKSKVAPTVNGASIILQQSTGLGQAILEGIPHARGDLLVTMDGDYSHNPNDLPRLLEASRTYDIVLGSRFISGGRTLDSRSRKSVSRFYRWFARTLLRLPLEDPMSGFCVAHRAVYEAVKLKPIGYKVNLELIYKAKSRGFTVAEVPITFYPRRAGHSNASMMEGLRTFGFILALKLGLS